MVSPLLSGLSLLFSLKLNSWQSSLIFPFSSNGLSFLRLPGASSLPEVVPEPTPGGNLESNPPKIGVTGAFGLSPVPLSLSADGISSIAALEF